MGLNCKSRSFTGALCATLALAACGRSAPYASSAAGGTGGGGFGNGGPARWLVLDSLRAGNRDLYALNVDTGRLVQLTTDGANDLEPEVSPDGTRVAFHSGTAIFVIGATGANEREVIAGPSDLKAFRRPIFNREDTALIADSNHEIEEITLATGARRLIVLDTTTTLRVNAPSLSPDGTRVAFDITCDTTRAGVWIAPVSASNRPCTDGARLTPTDAPWSGRPGFGPDGFIAFEQGEPGDGGQAAQIVVQQLGGLPRRLTSSGDNRNPKWAPASVDF